MKTIQSSLLLLAILGMTSIGCSQSAPPATEAPAATENAGDAAGSADKAAPVEGEDAGSDNKEG